MQETLVPFLGREDPLEKGKATQSTSLRFPWGSAVKESAFQKKKKRICLQYRRPGFDPWVGKIPQRRERLPFQYSGLENSMDCIVHAVTKSWTRLSDFHFQHIKHGARTRTYLENDYMNLCAIYEI